MNWFNENHIKIMRTIKDPFSKNIKGYVLPHAGTLYTGNILSHTLQFIPNNYFNKITIFYYPANDSENIIINQNEKYYHEYYVLMKTLNYVCKNIWNYDNKNINGVNIRDYIKLNKTIPKIDKNTLLIISADFSHFLPLNDAIKKENCASNALMYRKFDNNLECLNVVDTKKTFEIMYNIIPNNYNLHWIGRTRSPGLKGVGYLSFFIKKQQNIENLKMPNGIFITAYDANMQQRECLGEWFNKNKKYNITIENNLIKKVVYLASTSSRLTGGLNIEIPITNYTITYLYKTNNKKFIRGYHGIKYKAFFLPNVFLENTYNNGIWIDQLDKFWKKGNNFNIKYTLNKLNHKANNLNNNIDKKFTRKNNKKNMKPNYTLYYCDIVHKNL